MKKGFYELGGGARGLVIALGIAGGAAGFVLFGFLFMWLWNWIAPGILGLRGISYWEGWGILALSFILFHPKKLTPSIRERMRAHKLKKRMEEMDAGSHAPPP